MRMTGQGLSWAGQRRWLLEKTQSCRGADGVAPGVNTKLAPGPVGRPRCVMEVVCWPKSTREPWNALRQRGKVLSVSLDPKS